jgi:hypothetical protein
MIARERCWQELGEGCNVHFSVALTSVTQLFAKSVHLCGGPRLHVRLLCETPPIWKPRRDRRARSAKPGPPDPTASRKKEYPSTVPPFLSIQSLQWRTSRLRRYAAAIPWLRPTTCAPEGRRRRTTCPTTPRRHRYVNHLASSDYLLEPRLAGPEALRFSSPPARSRALRQVELCAWDLRPLRAPDSSL